MKAERSRIIFYILKRGKLKHFLIGIKEAPLTVLEEPALSPDPPALP